MPELAEVEYYRKRWDPGLGRTVLSVEIQARKRVFRDATVIPLARALAGQTLQSSRASGKQMLFEFSGGFWLGIHLGMTGKLRMDPPGSTAGPHDHFVARQASGTLVFEDPRQFGRLRCDQLPEPPAWWIAMAPPVLSKSFSTERVREFFQRRRRTPVKAALLMQERFPGIGNWMADEILWRSRISPTRLCQTLSASETRRIWRNTRFVSRAALRIIGRDFSDPPASWLFQHRWKAGGLCPRDGARLERKEVVGRTTCWCVVCQKA